MVKAGVGRDCVCEYKLESGIQKQQDHHPSRFFGFMFSSFSVCQGFEKVRDRQDRIGRGG
jgi:hypothetical protein